MVAPKQKLSDFLNLPQVKQFRNNLIIGSLLLIITKLAIPEYLNIYIRIILLIIYTGVSFIGNLREKIKIPVAIFLRNFLGLEFVEFYKDELKKNDYKFISCGNTPTFLATFLFESSWFSHYLFQKFYIFINGVRLYFDIYPVIYIIFYYNILFLILYLEAGYIISFFGLFMISTRLLVYLSENNFSEVCNSWMSTGQNQQLIEKKLKITKKNIMIFTFWNSRDVSEVSLYRSFLFDKPSEYSFGIIYLNKSNTKYKFSEEELTSYKELPLDFI